MCEYMPHVYKTDHYSYLDIHVVHTPFYTHTHKFKPHPFTNDTAIGGHISTLQTYIYN